MLGNIVDNLTTTELAEKELKLFVEVKSLCMMNQENAVCDIVTDDSSVHVLESS